MEEGRKEASRGFKQDLEGEFSASKEAFEDRALSLAPGNVSGSMQKHDSLTHPVRSRGSMIFLEDIVPLFFPSV